MKRADWLPVAVGAVLGFVIGLYYAWNVNPVRYTETAPSSLKPTYQREYLALIAAAFQGTGNLQKAESRLALFDYENPVEVLEALAQEELAQEGREREARALARLAAELEGSAAMSETQSPAAPARNSTSSTALPSVTPTATPPPPPTGEPTATPTPGPPFELVEREAICPGEGSPPLLQVEVEDAEGEPIPGVQVQVLWSADEDRFFTGLKPELSLGYGDFQLEPGVVYTVQLAEGAVPVTEIQSQLCETGAGEDYTGSVLLRFQQPDS